MQSALTAALLGPHTVSTAYNVRCRSSRRYGASLYTYTVRGLMVTTRPFTSGGALIVDK